MAADDGGVGPDGSPAPDERLPILVFAGDGTPGIQNIRKDTARAEENIVFADDAGIDGDIILNLYIISQHDTRRDNHILSDIASLANHAVRHDVREMPDARPGTYLATFVDDGGFVSLVFHRVTLIYRGGKS